MHILLTCDLQKKKIFFEKISKDHSSEKYTLNVHGYFVDVYFKNVMVRGFEFNYFRPVMKLWMEDLKI